MLTLNQYGFHIRAARIPYTSGTSHLGLALKDAFEVTHNNGGDWTMCPFNGSLERFGIPVIGTLELDGVPVEFGYIAEQRGQTKMENGSIVSWVKPALAYASLIELETLGFSEHAVYVWPADGQPPNLLHNLPQRPDFGNACDTQVQNLKHFRERATTERERLRQAKVDGYSPDVIESLEAIVAEAEAKEREAGDRLESLCDQEEEAIAAYKAKLVVYATQWDALRRDTAKQDESEHQLRQEATDLTQTIIDLGSGTKIYPIGTGTTHKGRNFSTYQIAVPARVAERWGFDPEVDPPVTLRVFHGDGSGRIIWRHPSGRRLDGLAVELNGQNGMTFQWRHTRTRAVARVEAAVVRNILAVRA